MNPQSAGNIGAGTFIGKKIVTVTKDFWTQPYVKEVIDPLMNEAKDEEKMEHAIKQELEDLIVPSSHSEHVT